MAYQRKGFARKAVSEGTTSLVAEGGNDDGDMSFEINQGSSSGGSGSDNSDVSNEQQDSSAKISKDDDPAAGSNETNTINGLSSASVFDGEILDFSHFDSKIAELGVKLLAMKVTGVDDKDGYEAVRKSRIGIKNLRVSIRKVHDDLKKKATTYGKKVDAIANVLTSKITPFEDHLESQEKFYIDEVAKKKKAEADARDLIITARLDALMQYGVIPNRVIVEAMTEDEFQARLSRAKTEVEEIERIKNEANERIRLDRERFEAEKMELERKRIEEEHRVEQQRLKIQEEMAVQRREMEAERKKLADERSEQAKKVATENTRLATEAARLKKIDDDRIANEKVEAARVVAEKKAEEDRVAAMAKMEKDRLAAIEKAEEDKRKKEANDLLEAEMAKRRQSQSQEPVVANGDEAGLFVGNHCSGGKINTSISDSFEGDADDVVDVPVSIMDFPEGERAVRAKIVGIADVIEDITVPTCPAYQEIMDILVKAGTDVRAIAFKRFVIPEKDVLPF